jgi:hypothetical protein
VPTLLSWPHSALIYDLKGENWTLTAGARKRMGLSQVYLRHWRYQQDCYPARASIWAPAPARVRPTVPTPREMRG